MNKKTVYAVIGPTAGGKSALGLALAERMGGEIVCMDSMQVYRGMDIGTAKPDAQEQRRVPHHLLDVREPGEAFTVSDWVAEASDVLARVPVPILVGGTGLYLKALMEGSDLGGVAGDEAVREKYRAYARENGADKLHALLAKRDEASAARLHPHDVKRVIRALEILDLTGEPIRREAKSPGDECPWRFKLIYLCPEREKLYDRINTRVDQMMALGLLEEVRVLFDRGIPEESQAIQGLGYKELYHYLRGEISLEGAVRLIKTRTRHYAKRQMTFFRQFEGCLKIEEADPDRVMKALNETE